MLEMVAMSLLDLRDLMNANYEQMARGQVLSAFGQAVGAIAAGVLFGVCAKHAACAIATDWPGAMDKDFIM